MTDLRTTMHHDREGYLMPGPQRGGGFGDRSGE